MLVRWMIPLLSLGLLFSSLALLGQDTPATVKKIIPSLAFVIAPKDAVNAELGTAWCFWSTASKSYYITNHHVVMEDKEVFLRPEFLADIGKPSPLVKGRVYPVTAPYKDPINVQAAADVDLRVIVIDIGRAPYLTISQWNPDMGGSIGIAGYPSFHVDLAGANQPVSPSVHFGTANSFPDHYMEFDALADHGNSGGPVFDRRTGNVYGAVDLGIQSKTSQSVQNNLAIDSNTLGWFLDQARLPYVSYSSATKTTINMESCNSKPWDKTRALIASVQADQWWCALPDAPK